MDRTGGVTLSGVVVGVICGMGIGILYEKMARAWRDHQGAQAVAGKAEGIAKRNTWEFMFLGFLLAVAVAFALGTANDG